MNKSNSVLTLCCALAFTFSACGQNNDIAKRWSVAGHMVQGQLIPLSKSKDFEFLKNSVFNNYDNGLLTVHGTYVVASDKKSVLLKGDGKSETFKIIKLKGNEFTMLFFGNGLDTIICYAYGSDLTKKAQQKSVAYEDIQTYSVEVSRSYDLLDATVGTMIAVCIGESQNNNEVFVKYFAAHKAISTPSYSKENSVKKEADKNRAIYDNLYNAANSVIDYTKKHPEIIIYPAKLSGYIDGLPQIYKDIDTSNAQLEKAIKIYTQN